MVVLYLGYASRALFLLGVQFLAIPILFLVGPVWLFGIFFTIVDIVIRLIPSVENPSLPILCSMIGIGQPYCVPALIAYHLVSAVLAYIVVKYGDQLLDVSVAWYGRLDGWLTRQVRP